LKGLNVERLESYWVTELLGYCFALPRQKTGGVIVGIFILFFVFDPCSLFFYPNRGVIVGVFNFV